MYAIKKKVGLTYLNYSLKNVELIMCCKYNYWEILLVIDYNEIAVTVAVKLSNKFIVKKFFEDY